MNIVACDYEHHAAPILAILNHAIVSSTALFDYKPRAPAVQPVPPKKVEEDTAQAVREIDRQRTDQMLRDAQPSPPRRPDLDRDVTGGVQTRGLNDALRR